MYNISVHKFGGSSQTIKGYNLIKEMVTNLKDSERIVVIVSAIKNITDKIINLISNISKINSEDLIEEIIEINNNFADTLDSSIDLTDLILYFYSLVDELKKNNINQNKINLISIGEYFTSTILNRFLLNNKIKSCKIDSEFIIKSNKPNNLFLYNDGNFSVNDFYIHENFKKNKIIIIPGFSGSDSNEEICLLGRGGSDTSGSIIAEKLKAKEYIIWTDVSGLYTSDPSIYHNSKLIENINYNTAQELAAMGAKVLHPYCILPCANSKVPILIKNTFKPNDKNTKISDIKDNSDFLSITCQHNISYFKIHSLNMWNNYGFVNDIFLIFTEFCVDVNIINTSQFTITTTTNDLDIEKLVKLKNKLLNKYKVELIHELSLVSIVANNLITNPKTSKIFNFIKDKEIIMTSFSSNNKSISFLIDTKKSRIFIRDLHNDVIIN